MVMEKRPLRRDVLKKLALGGAGMLTFGHCTTANTPSEHSDASAKEAKISLKGKVNHSVCRWCYSKIPLEAFCEGAQDIGIRSIELTGPEEWPTLRKYGLDCAMANAPWVSLTEGFNNPDFHERLQKSYRQLIDQAADAGCQQVIVFSGNRNGLSDAEGLEHCAKGLDPLLKQAQQRGIVLTMELLNSKVDHADYQCDHTAWGVALAEKLGSTQFKLLYDIYHMQIMEGDVIATIRKYKDYIGHFHTGGVPGRNEIDESQELYYPAILQAIVDTGFTGFVAQEFIPKRPDAMDSLRQGVAICDV